eukprot:Clim_evm106s157 gene=Clim_evmTU106s157
MTEFNVDDEVVGLFGGDEVVAPKRKPKKMDRRHWPTFLKGINTLHRSKLPPEDEYGDTEYKFTLENPGPSRVQHLTTQMKWRLAEGNGKAFYELGVHDDGEMAGLTASQLEASLSTLEHMATGAEGNLKVLGATEVTTGKFCVRVQVTWRPLAKQTRKVLDPNSDDKKGTSGPEVLSPRTIHGECRVALLGAEGAGKSTLLGILTHGDLDNGSGMARLNLFRHKHEIESGKTSSTSRELLGYGPDGVIYRGALRQESDWTKRCQNSTHMYHFADLAGSRRFSKTAITGLLSHHPDIVMLVVGATTNEETLLDACLEQISLANALGSMLVIVLTKIDQYSSESVGQACEFLQQQVADAELSREGIVVDSDQAADAMVERMRRKHGALGFVPIIPISAVSGNGVDVIHALLSKLPLPPKGGYGVTPMCECSRGDIDHRLNTSMCLTVEETFQVAGVGLVVGGKVLNGKITEGDIVQVGPMGDGTFKPMVAWSIHCKRLPINCLHEHTSGTIALRSVSQESCDGVEQDPQNVIRGSTSSEESDVDDRGASPEPGNRNRRRRVLNRVHRGCVLIGADDFVVPTIQTQCRVFVLKGSLKVSNETECTLHVGAIRQQALVSLVKAIAGRRQNEASAVSRDTAVLELRFKWRPEVFPVGAPVFIDGPDVRAMGYVCACESPVIALCDSAMHREEGA